MENERKLRVGGSPLLVPEFVAVHAWVAIIGALALVAGNIVGSIVVPGHDWIADTVSDLAAGRYEIIQDVTLYAFAAALICLSLAAAHLHDGSRAWSVLVYTLVLLALCVTIIAARNEYGDGDKEGIVIHIYVVYALGALFITAFSILGFRGHRFGRGVIVSSRVSAIIWLIGTPVFFNLPTSIDGAFERFLGIVAVIWCIIFAMAMRRWSFQHG